MTADAFIALHLRDRDLSDTTLNRLRETLSWAHLELFGEERWDRSIPNWLDKALTIGWTFFGAAAWALVTGIFVYLYPSPRNVEVLLAVIALTSVATAVTTGIAVRDLPKDLRRWRLKYPAGLVEDLAARWPDGRPRLLADPRRYFDFLADYQTVFTMAAQDLLQWAIRRSWSSVINPNFRNAFISHSHAQADVAHRLADALKARGLSIGLDAWSLGQDADDPSVERWIIETILSTDVMIYLLTKESAQSGWVRRETDWEFRLKTLKESSSLPYCVVLDSIVDLGDYPPDRLVDGRALMQDSGGERLLDELALRIWADHFTRLRQIKHYQSLGIRPKEGEEFLQSLGVAVPEAE